MTTPIIKEEFRGVLNPMMDLFEYKKSMLQPDEWIRFVHATKERIIANPEQFLGGALPAGSIIQETVNEIFADYLEEKR